MFIEKCIVELLVLICKLFDGKEKKTPESSQESLPGISLPAITPNDSTLGPATAVDTISQADVSIPPVSEIIFWRQK